MANDVFCPAISLHIQAAKVNNSIIHQRRLKYVGPPEMVDGLEKLTKADSEKSLRYVAICCNRLK